jgi:hypothetical protein
MTATIAICGNHPGTSDRINTWTTKQLDQLLTTDWAIETAKGLDFLWALFDALENKLENTKAQQVWLLKWHNFWHLFALCTTPYKQQGSLYLRARLGTRHQNLFREQAATGAAYRMRQNERRHTTNHSTKNDSGDTLHRPLKSRLALKRSAAFK